MVGHLIPRHSSLTHSFMAIVGAILPVIKSGPCCSTLCLLVAHGFYPFRSKYDIIVHYYLFRILLIQLSVAVTVFFHEDGLLVLTMSCFGSVSVLLYTFQTRYKFRGPTPV